MIYILWGVSAVIHKEVTLAAKHSTHVVYSNDSRARSHGI